MIKTLDKIQYSKYPPTNTSLLWDDGIYLRIHRNTGWEIVGTAIAPPDWNQSDESKTSFIKNRTHYIKGTQTQIDIENCRTNTLILPNITVLPIMIDNTFINEFGTYEILYNDKVLRFEVIFREGVKYIGAETIHLNIPVMTNITVKKLDNMYLDLATTEDVNNILKEVFDE